MSTAILDKCIEELQKASPDISYIRGALETLRALSGDTLSVGTPYAIQQTAKAQPQGPVDEEADPVLAAYLAGGTGTLQPEY